MIAEHRFYGTTLPQGWNTSSNGLALLTMEQAVADLAVFRDKFQRQVLAPLGQSENAWITVGCGYSGALAAWAHTKHPQHFAGAWASSPPLLPSVEFPQHDMHDLNAIGEQCASKLRTISDMIEMEFSNIGPDGPFRLKALFHAPEKMALSDFRYMLADSISLAVQHGYRRLLCDALTSSSNDDDLVFVFANITQSLWGASFAGSCHFHTDCLSSVEHKLTAARSWHWQV